MEQRLKKKVKFLRKFLQNFLLCWEIPGRSKVDFWRDYQQILKKQENISRELSEKFETIVRKFWENFQSIFKIFHFWEN